MCPLHLWSVPCRRHNSNILLYVLFESATRTLVSRWSIIEPLGIIIMALSHYGTFPLLLLYMVFVLQRFLQDVPQVHNPSFQKLSTKLPGKRPDLPFRCNVPLYQPSSLFLWTNTMSPSFSSISASLCGGYGTTTRYLPGKKREKKGYCRYCRSVYKATCL